MPLCRILAATLVLLVLSACAAPKYYAPSLIQRASPVEGAAIAPSAPVQAAQDVSLIWDQSFHDLADMEIEVGSFWDCNFGGAARFSEKQVILDALAENTSRNIVVDEKIELDENSDNPWSGYSISYSLYDAAAKSAVDIEEGDLIIPTVVRTKVDLGLSIRMTVRDDRRILFQDLASSAGSVSSRLEFRLASDASCGGLTEELFRKLTPVLMQDINARFTQGLQQISFD